MKRIVIPAVFLCLATCCLTACHPAPQSASQPASQPAATDPAPANVTVETAISETNVDTVAIDGVTEATNVANIALFNGILVLPPQQHATVTLPISGAIRHTSLLSGHYVRKGEVIATLDNPDFITLQQTYLDALAQTEFLEKEYLRQQTLSREEASSQKRFQQSKADYLSMKSRLEAAAAQLALLGADTQVLKEKGIRPYLEIKAPLTGYVTNTNLNIGKYLQAGDPVCDVIDKSRLLLQLTAYEKDLRKLNPGSTVQFRVNGMGEQTFEAILLSIDQMVNDENRSIKVYAQVKSANPLFRPGMYVSATIKEN